MTDPEFHRYLRAKRTVDDRALAMDLLDRLAAGLATRADAKDGPLRILEIGAGIGTMIERFVEWDVLPAGEVQYTAVDIDGSNVMTIRRSLPSWATDRGLTVTGAKTLVLTGEDRSLTVDPVHREATRFIESRDVEEQYDLLIGAALLDVLGLDRLPVLLSTVAQGGFVYFPITFDGATRFTPSRPADRPVERYYHEHMDTKPNGDSRAGQHALERLQDHPEIVDIGVAASDWIVRPVDGTYPADEKFFLEYVLDTIGDAVGELDRGGDLPDELLDEWVEERKYQLSARKLVYLTHQLDLLARIRVPSSPP